MSESTFQFVIGATHQPRRQTLALHLLISFVLFAVGIFCLVMYWFTGISPNFKMAIGAFGFFGALCFAGGIAVYALSISVVRRARYATLLRVLELLLLAGGAVLFFLNDWIVPAVLSGILAGLAIVAALYEIKTPADTVIQISGEGVFRKAGLKSTHLRWRELQQVLYRRSILTIDCVDNRLYQYPVQAPQIDGPLFEAFCADQIAQALPDRQKANW
ncbi:MAG: hypothetical protein EOP52_01520 [Sphingobacteriales bacterium]|nr:MAG: hypothetical protein EOP52_01520 [Sphingobacteriales bacterium]